MKNECHLGTHVSGGRKPCEKGAFHRELIPSATTLSIIHAVRIALRAGGVSLLPAVARTQAEARIYLFNPPLTGKIPIMCFSPRLSTKEGPKMAEQPFLSSMQLTWMEEDVVLHVCDNLCNVA